MFEDATGALYLCKIKKFPGSSKNNIRFYGKSLNLVSFNKNIKSLKMLKMEELQENLKFDHDLRKWNLDDTEENFFENVKVFFSFN